MSANAATLFGKKYASNVDLLLQQKGSRLRNAVMVRTDHSGDQSSPVDQVGSIAATQATTRFGAIGRTDAALSRRWINPSDWNINQLFDSFDSLKIISDPKSVYVQNAVLAMGRKMDELILEAMFGTNNTGTTGSGTVTYLNDGGNVVDNAFGAAATIGLTVAKMREARRLLMGNDVDMTEELFIAVNAKAHDSLLAETQVISTDYNSKPVLVDGVIDRFLGFKFIHTELLEVTSDPYTKVPCWAKSGVHLGIWMDVISQVSQRNDLESIPWQAYLKMSMGATRLEGKKLVQIEADEA